MTALFGRYDYVSELGRGATSRVLCVADRAEHGAKRALKVVRDEDAAWLVWEFSRLSRLSHPRLARVFELLRVERPVHAPFGLPARALVLVEELAPGDTWLRSAARFADDARALERAAFQVACSIAEALCVLHDAGLVHGDVKPENVVVDAASGEAKLVDLGLARAPGVNAQPRGTPRNMAPELYAGMCNFAADVYALGASLHDVLHEHGSREASSRAGASASPRSFVPSAAVSQPLSDVIARFTASDPADRPSDGREALSALWVVGEQLGFRAAGSSLRVAASSSARSPAVLAQRARSLPFVGPRALVSQVVDALETRGFVLLRGERGAGRARLVREALRTLHEARASLGRSGPTCVTSLAALESLESSSVLVALADPSPAELASARRIAESARLAGREVMIVASCAPNTRDEGALALDVGPLSDDELRELVMRALSPRDVDPSVLSAIARASGRFAGRVVDVVADALGAGRDPDDPASYHGISAADTELSGVSPHAMQLLTLLAWNADLALDPERVSSRLGGHVLGALDELSARGVLEVVEGGLRVEAALARTVRARTREDARSHLLEVPAVERCSGPRLWARGDRVAAVGAFARELTSLRMAGRVDEACAVGEEALSFVDDEALRCELADAHRAAGRYREARAWLRDAMSERALLLRAELARLVGDTEAAGADLERVRERGDRVACARATALTARIAYDRGDVARAEALVAELGALDDPEAELRTLEARLLCSWARGTNDLGLAHHMVTRAAQVASPRFRARALALRAQAELRRGERRRALEDYREAIHIARRAGEAHEAATHALNAGLVELEAGELGPALTSLDEAAYRLACIDRPHDLLRVLFNLGNAALLVGDDARAEVVLSAARARLRNGPDPLALASTEVAWSELCLRRGDVDGAVRCLGDVLPRLPEGLDSARALVAARLAQACLAVDALERAAEVLAEADGACPAADVSTRLEVDACAVRVELSRGEPEQAERRARAALLRATDEAPFAERLRLVLAASDAARADGNEREADARAALCRAWLESAMAGLSTARRNSMRAVPAYARLLAASLPLREAEPARSSQRWRSMVRAARKLFAETTRAALAKRVVDELLALVHAERAMIIGSRHAGEEPSVLAHAALNDSLAKPVFSRSVIERALGEQRAIVSVEASQDQRFDGAQSLHTMSVRSVLALPLEGTAQRAVLYLDDRVRSAAFDADDVALAEDFAALAAQAFQRLRERKAQTRRVRKAELEQRALSEEVERLSAMRETAASGQLVHTSEVMRRTLELARRAAASDAPLVIVGESGTGKELCARYVHDESRRRSMPFVAESCASIPESLLESTLFGHVRGAFTGADRAKKGLFELADGGTLLLDEVGEMSPVLQAKLLRVLQEGEIRPVGSERTRRVDVRVLAATHRDLAELVRQGAFREDLYYRLAVVTLELPPLRARREDIPLLLAHFIQKHAGGRNVRTSPEVVRALELERWPGNVRELENRVRRALVLADGELRLEHVTISEAQAAPFTGELDLHAQTELLTRTLVEQALARAGGNLSRAAELLGISRFGLQKMVKRFDLGPYGTRSRK